MPPKMLDDFRFLFPKKEDSYKNIIKDEDLLKKVNYEYCLYYYNKEDRKNINLINQLNISYNKTVDGKPIFEPPIKKCELDIIKKLINKKMDYFNQLLKYHSTIMLKYKKAGSLSISIRLPLNKFVYVQTNNMDLKYFIKKFFNNTRSRKSFSKNVIGYYWVILLDSLGNPHININFYLKNKDFNSLIGYDINEMCFNILNKHGIKGEIIYHTLTENLKTGKAIYNNQDYHQIKDCNYSSRISGFCNVVLDIANDAVKKDKSHEDLNKGMIFNQHLYRLAKKTYFLPSGRSIGFSSIS